MAAITRTDLNRTGAMRAFPRLSQPGVLPLGQTVFSIIASIPTDPGVFEAFILQDADTAVSVVLAHDKERKETVVVLFEKAVPRNATPQTRHAAPKLLMSAWRAGLVELQPKVVAVAGSAAYSEAIGRMVPEFTPSVKGAGGQLFVVLDLSALGA